MDEMIAGMGAAALAFGLLGFAAGHEILYRPAAAALEQAELEKEILSGNADLNACRILHMNMILAKSPGFERLDEVWAPQAREQLPEEWERVCSGAW